MDPLLPSFRRELRARAHHLHPVVSIGQHGLTPAVLHEIDVALSAHELIKVRVFGDDRQQRETLSARICAETDCAAVQQIGKLLVLWRPRPVRADDGEAIRIREKRPAGATQRRLSAVVPTPAAAPRRAPRGQAPSGVPRAAAPRRRRAAP